VVWSASGSSSGLLGSDGHTCWFELAAAPAAAFPAASPLIPGSVTTESGTTCATATLLASAPRSFAETVAANAFRPWKRR
jgi:hypothetical protein